MEPAKKSGSRLNKNMDMSTDSIFEKSRIFDKIYLEKQKWIDKFFWTILPFIICMMVLVLFFYTAGAALNTKYGWIGLGFTISSSLYQISYWAKELRKDCAKWKDMIEFPKVKIPHQNA